MTEPSSSVPSTSIEHSKQGELGANKLKKREYTAEDDWKIFLRLKERLTKEEESSANGVPNWLVHQYSPEEWKKLSFLEKWRLRQEAKAAGSMSMATAHELLAKSGIQRSKINSGIAPTQCIPQLLVENEHSGVLRQVDVLEDDDIAGDDDDAEGPTRGLPDWAIPKDRLYRSFLQFRAELDMRTEERLLRDSFMVFDDDPIMAADPKEATPAKPEIFKLRPLMMTTVEWDDWKKEKPIPIVRMVNPAHDLVRERKRASGRYGMYWEHNLKPSEIAKLRAEGINEENPLFFWDTPSSSSLQGRKYFIADDFKRTTKLAKIAVANLTSQGVPLTEESIRNRLEELDDNLAAMKKALKQPRETSARIGDTQPSTSKTPDLAVSIPKEETKNTEEQSTSPMLSPDSPSKRVLPARTRKPTVKEAERREDEKGRAASRRSRDKCSKEREQTSPATTAAAECKSESPEKEPAESTSAASTKTSPVQKKGNEMHELTDTPRRRQGIIVDSDDTVQEQEDETIGKSKDGEEIVLVKKGDGWSIRFDKPADSVEKKTMIPMKNPSVDDDDCFSDEDEDAPSTAELMKLHPSELIVYRDGRGEPRLAPRCCLADVRDGVWVACPRPGRNDFMSASLAKRAYEMDMNIAWRYEAANQRLCQLHSRLLRTAGEGGNVQEEMIGWMGRRDCTDLERQLIGREPVTPLAEIEKEETKWMNWKKPVSAQILMQQMKDVNKEARRFVCSLRDRKKRKRVKRVRRVPKGMKKETRMFEWAQFCLEQIEVDDLTEADVAGLSGKERRSLAELIRINKKRLAKERRQIDKIIKRKEDRENTGRPLMTPVSCDSVTGSASEFEKAIGPLIQCMVHRRKRDWPSKIRPIKRIPSGAMRKREIVGNEQQNKEKVAKKQKKTVKMTKRKKIRRRQMTRRKVVTLKSGELFDVTKYRRIRQKMTALVEEMKSSPAKKLEAFESLLGKKIPGLQLALKKEEKMREHSILSRSEYVPVSLSLLSKGKKRVSKQFYVIGVIRDHVAEAATKLRDPLLFLAYNMDDKSKTVVKLMPALPEKVMKGRRRRAGKDDDSIITEEAETGNRKPQEAEEMVTKKTSPAMRKGKKTPVKTTAMRKKGVKTTRSLEKMKNKRKNWIDKRMSLYTRPGVIVVRRRATLLQLAQIRRTCLEKIAALPNFDKMLDDIVKEGVKKLCTTPSRRKISKEDVEVAKRNPTAEKRRELWMAEIDRSLRVYGFLPPSVPEEFIEERADELAERMDLAIEVEEALHYEECRQRAVDAAGAAAAAIDEDSDEEVDAHRRNITTLQLAGAPCSSAPSVARISNELLLQLQSVYDKLKDEKTYWNEREDNRWRKIPHFRPPPHPLPPVDLHDEMPLLQTSAVDGNAKLTTVPKGAALIETEATKSAGQESTGKKISLKRALRNVDTSSMTLPQMKKMIAGLRKMKAQRTNRLGGSKKLKLLTNVNTSDESASSLRSEETKDASSHPLLPSHALSLLEWSMAQPSVEEIAMELEEHGQNVRTASEQQVRRSIIRLRALKQSVYEKLRPAVEKEEELPMTVKIGEVEKASSVPTVPQRLEKPADTKKTEQQKEENEKTAQPPRKKSKKEEKSNAVETTEQKTTAKRKLSAAEQKRRAADQTSEGSAKKKKKMYVVKLRNQGGSYNWDRVEAKASKDDKKRYLEQRNAAREGREALRKRYEEEDEEKKEEKKALVEPPKKRKKRRREVEEEETLLDEDGKILAKKKRKQVDPTGFSLLPTRSIYRYRDRFGLPKDEGDSRAALVFGAAMHFNKLEGSANAIPYFVQAIKSGGNYLDERDARHLRKALERQREEAEQLAAAGLQPATPPPARGTRYRVAANQQKQLVKEADNGDNEDDSQGS